MLVITTMMEPLTNVKSTNVLLTVKMNGEIITAQKVNTSIVIVHGHLSLLLHKITVKENGTVMIFITSLLKL